MQGNLRKIREERADGDRGFTLIELLVVVVIIGILIAIAIPLYLNYRKGAANKSAESDIRGAITAAEQYYTENSNAYPATQSGAKGVALQFVGSSTQTAPVSAGNTLTFTNDTDTYWICAQNEDGGTIYVYSSAKGGAVAKSAELTLADCATNTP